MLLPLAEPGLLGLDLLREALAQCLLFLLELGVVELLNLALPEFTRLHLLLAVILVMDLLGRRDEIEHERADQQRAQLLEIAVRFVLDFGYTPEVLAALDDAAVGSLDVLGRTDDAEGHRVG